MSAWSVVGFVLLGILAAILLLLCIPIWFSGAYPQEKQVQVSVRWFFFRWTYGQKKQKKHKQTIPKQTHKPTEEKTSKKYSPEEFIEIARVILDLLSSAGSGVRLFLRHLHIYQVRLQMCIAHEDAAQTAIAYGRINAAVYGLYANAAHFLNLSIPQIEIQPDFKAEEGTVEFQARAWILPIFVLVCAACIGWGFLGKTIQRRKNLSAQSCAKDEKVVKNAKHGGNLDE